MGPDDFARLASYVPKLAAGTAITVVLTLISISAATILGFGVAVIRRSRIKAARLAGGTYVTVIRNTPELVQFYLIFYALPVTGILVPPFVAAVIVLAVAYGAYLSEVFRGGIDSIERGQWEAARVLGMSPWTKWRLVILPQVARRVVPQWGNYLVVMFKTSALAGAITVRELFFTGQDLASANFRYFEIFTIIAVIYFSIGYPASRLLRRAERRLARHEFARA